MKYILDTLDFAPKWMIPKVMMGLSCLGCLSFRTVKKI